MNLQQREEEGHVSYQCNKKQSVKQVECMRWGERREMPSPISSVTLTEWCDILWKQYACLTHESNASGF